MSKTYDEIFDELDSAARNNLSTLSVREYEQYKVLLIARGVKPDDVDLILRGFIWDQSESEAVSEIDDE